MSEKQTEVQQLALKLDALFAAKKPYSTGACGQIVGCESYILKGTGFSFSCIDEAAWKLIDLEKANAELTKALKAIVRSADLNQAAINMPLLSVACEALEKHGGE